MLYKVRRNGKSGYINRDGEMVVPIEADSCLDFTDFGGVVKRPKLDIIDDKGKVLGSCNGVQAMWPFSERRILVYDKANRAQNAELAAGYLDENGTWAIPPKFRQAGQFCGGVAVASVSFRQTSHTEGLIDLAGNWLFKPKFSEILDFNCKMLTTIARQEIGNRGDEHWLLIDKSGQQVGTEFYEHGWGGGDGLISVMRDGKYGCVDESGRLVIPFAFEDISVFSEGFAAARIDDEKVGVIDNNGHWAIHPVFTGIERFSEGLAAAQVKENGVYKWGFIDCEGEWVIKPQFEEAYPFRGGIAEVIPFGVNPDEFDDRAYIDRQGKYIWEPQSQKH